MSYFRIHEQIKKNGLDFRGQTFSGATGTMAAALAADAIVFAARYPAAATGKMAIVRMHLHYTCIGAFTAPVSAGRRLTLRVGSGGDVSGGTDLNVERKDSALSGETLLTGQIATTAGLTANGATFGTGSKRRLGLVGKGAAGADYDEVWCWDAYEADPLVLNPGQILGIVNPAQFDAAGTWQLFINGDAVEIK